MKVEQKRVMIFYYDGKWHLYKNRTRGDRGRLPMAEKKALDFVRSLIKEGHTGIKYREIKRDYTPFSLSRVEVTW